MDGSRFDAWTRRRFGVAAGGVAASLVSLAQFGTAGAKNKKKKKKKRCPVPSCRTVLQSCDPNSEGERCCQGLNCDLAIAGAGLQCCRGLRTRCSPPDNGTDECCFGLICSGENGDTPRCCAPNHGDPCEDTIDCCGGGVCESGSCNIPSDRALKANLASVDPADMLQRVASLPITTWNYTFEDASVRHIGPMAQDFAAAFGVGTDDRHIHPIDGQGVALAAIQGLAAELDRLRAENARLAARIARLDQSPR